MLIYYAHALNLYGTPQEKRDVELLENLGFKVYNPNCEEGDIIAKTKGMAGFKTLVDRCGALAYRALPDGRIPSGVVKEIEWARASFKPVIELPYNFLSRQMTVEETAAYLAEIGQR